MHLVTKNIASSPRQHDDIAALESANGRISFLDLWHGTLKAMGEVPFGDYAAKVEPGNAWAAQTIWFDAVANQVTAQLVAKWQDRLGGLDTFTHDTVIAAIISISTDAPKHMP